MLALRACLTLLLFQSGGELLHALLRLPVPGPVLGMALLAGWLLRRGGDSIDPSLAKMADLLLTWLGLLFVPAGVGIVANLALLRSAWLPLAASLTVSTILSLLVTAALLHGLVNRRKNRVA